MKPLSPSLLHKLKESLQTIANDAQPNVQVVVSRAKNTVTDADYWTVETIREMSGLGDISIAPRRFIPRGRPNRLYGIYVQNGIVKTLIREYPDKLNQGWADQFVVGPGSSVAMAFNGYWEQYRTFWRLITDEKPFISWVDNNNILWSQHWDNTATKFQLASNVVKVRMLRGWKNTIIQQNDQGVIVGYIKSNGKVYYRNYCNQEDYSTVWEFEKELTEFTGVAVNLNMFITADYRMGFVIEDNFGQAHWLVTHRNWGGMASPAENINTSISDISFEVLPIHNKSAIDLENINTSITDITFNLAEPIYPTLLSIANDNPISIRLIFSHIIDYDLSTVKSAFSVKDSANTKFNILSTSSGVNNTELILNLNNFNGAYGDMTVVYDRNIINLDSLNQGSRFTLEGFAVKFTPIIVPLEGTFTESISTAVTDVTFKTTQVYYKDKSISDNIDIAITDINFVVTKIGNNPL